MKSSLRKINKKGNENYTHYLSFFKHKYSQDKCVEKGIKQRGKQDCPVVALPYRAYRFSARALFEGPVAMRPDALSHRARGISELIAVVDARKPQIRMVIAAGEEFR
jgi:hypothetical protein